MLVARAPLTLSILPAGLGLAAAAWLVFGGANPPGVIAQLNGRLDAVRPRLGSPRPTGPNVTGALVLSRPVFTLASSGAGGDATLTLQGLALGAGRKAALIAVGSQPAVWLAVGESRSGVTLRRVDASSALVETLSGDHAITLGSAAAATLAASPQATPSLAAPGAVAKPPASPEGR